MKLTYLLTAGLLTSTLCMNGGTRAIAQGIPGIPSIPGIPGIPGNPSIPSIPGTSGKPGTPPASTFQPGPWQPVARADVSRPVVLKIINSTDMVLDYDLTANINPSPQQIAAGDSTKLKNVRLPAYILINRSQSAAVRNPISLIYAVEVTENNEITVTVTTAPSEIPGYTTMNIDRNGAIYVY